jgi:hypothetical protein
MNQLDQSFSVDVAIPIEQTNRMDPNLENYKSNALVSQNNASSS